MSQAKNSHGGARKGAGRPPKVSKAVRHGKDLASAEGLIIAALPEVIEGLVKAAKNGDVCAAKLLFERAWDRTTQAS